jgi:hypothetical protein
VGTTGVHLGILRQMRKALKKNSLRCALAQESERGKERELWLEKTMQILETKRGARAKIALARESGAAPAPL